MCLKSKQNNNSNNDISNIDKIILITKISNSIDNHKDNDNENVNDNDNYKE